MTLARQPKAAWGRVLRKLSLDKRWQIACAAALLLGIVAALASGPVVRGVAKSRAAALGISLDIGGVRPGWFSVSLRDTAMTLDGVSAMRVRLDRIVVKLSPWLAPRGVEVLGGEVLIEGVPSTVRAQLDEFRARRPASAAKEGSRRSGGLPVHVTGMALAWREFEPGAPVQTASGIHLERSPDTLRAGFDHAKFQISLGGLEAHAVSLDFDAASRALRSLQVDRLVGRLQLEPPGAPAEPPLLAASPSSAATPPVAASAASGHTQLAPAADAPQSPLAAWLSSLATRDWAARQLRLAALKNEISERVAEGARIDLEQVTLELARGSELLNVGPAPFRVKRLASAVEASFISPQDEAGRAVAFTIALPFEPADIDVGLEGGPIRLATLGVREGDFGLLGVEQSELTVATHLTLSPDGLLTASASGKVAQLSLQHRALAPEPLEGIDLAWSGRAELDLQRRKLAVEGGELGLEGVRVVFGAELSASDTDLRVALELQVPKTPCQDLLEAAPRALLPQLEGLKLGGNFGLDARVAFDTSTPKATEVEWDLDNRCKVKETPFMIDPQRFREPFQHFISDAEGRATEMTTGPSTEHWVPLNDITPNMETALIVCEDSRFFSHDGFDDKAIRDSIMDNLAAGRFVRGASTLSMQLAKNLYLGREKTLSRKLQEAAFTMLLEQRLSKEDILELYLNVVEFGPGIYGIRQASSHYFNSHPGELSLGQALYLGSILPSPKANHFAADGTLRPGWAQHLQYLMRIARKINRISDEELAAGLSEQLVFGQAHPSTESDFLFGTPLFEMGGG